MDAILIVDRDGNQEHVLDTVKRMVRRLEPTAEKLGCLEELSGINDILEIGAAYQRFIEVAKRNDGSLDAVVEHMRSEMKTDKPLPSAFFTSPERQGPR